MSASVHHCCCVTALLLATTLVTNTSASHLSRWLALPANYNNNINNNAALDYDQADYDLPQDNARIDPRFVMPGLMNRLRYRSGEGVMKRNLGWTAMGGPLPMGVRFPQGDGSAPGSDDNYRKAMRYG